MKAIIDKTTRIGRTMALCLGLAAAVLPALAAAPGSAAEAENERVVKNAGQIVFYSNRTAGQGVNNPTGDYEIFVMKPDGTDVKQVTFNAVNDYSPSLSPDGEKIAFNSAGDQFSNPEGDGEIYIMNADGSDQQNLTNTANAIQELRPDFSPDGKKIAYWTFSTPGFDPSNPEGDNEVYLMNADGSGRQNLTNNGAIHDRTPDFSPDGKKIAYHSTGAQFSNFEGDGEVYLMNADGSGRQNLTNTAAGIQDHDPDFSPDGQKIAFVSAGAQFSNPEGDGEVYVMNANGSGRQNLTNTAGGIQDDYPDFSPNGQKIAFTGFGALPSNPEGDMEIYLMNADGSGRQILTNTANGVFDYIPDFGRRKG